MLVIELTSLNEDLLDIVKSNDVHNHHNIGAVLRAKRLLMDLTLDELCSGVCCVGYESKVERNRCKVVNENIVPKLCERLKIDYEEMMTGTSIEELKAGLEEFVLKDEISLKKRLEKCNFNCNFTENNLIGCMYYLLTKNYKGLNELVQWLDKVKSSLDAFEMLCLLIVLIEYFIQTNQFEKAKEYLNLANELKSDNIHIRALIEKERIIIDCNLYSEFNNINLSKDLKLDEVLMWPVSTQIEVELETLKKIDSSKALIILKSLEREEWVRNSFSFRYNKALVLTRLERFKEALEYLDSMNDYNYKLVCLYAYSMKEYLRLNKVIEEDTKELKDKLKKHIADAKLENGDNIDVAFLKLMQMEISRESDSAIFNYIKSEMFALFKTFNNAFYFKYCLKRMHELIKSLAKYKESYEMLDYLHFK